MFRLEVFGLLSLGSREIIWWLCLNLVGHNMVILDPNSLTTRDVHKSIGLGLRVNLWLDLISSGVGVCHPPSTDNHQVFYYCLPLGLRTGSVGLAVWLQIYNHTQKNPQITVQCTTSNRTTTTTIATSPYSYYPWPTAALIVPENCRSDEQE